MNTPYQNQNNDLINLINILSFVVGLNEINRRFDEQNKILEEQNVMLTRLLKLLEAQT